MYFEDAAEAIGQRTGKKGSLFYRVLLNSYQAGADIIGQPFCGRLLDTSEAEFNRFRATELDSNRTNVGNRNRVLFKHL